MLKNFKIVLQKFSNFTGDFMKKIKKAMALFVALLLGLFSFENVVSAAQEDEIFTTEQIDSWETEFNESAYSEEPIGDFKNNSVMTYSSYGSWTWRDGVICITDSYASSPLFNNGHAGIVGVAPNYYCVVEANPGSGVKNVWGNWSYKYKDKTVWQVGVTSTTVEQDQAAAEWATKQVGKPYNGSFLNKTKTDSFYCSQLVWAAYKYTAGVDLDTWRYASAVHPFELYLSDKTTLIYRNK